MSKINTLQQEFNAAIIRRDKICRVRDNAHCCCGALQCSHFHAVGGSSSLRFYPFNAFAQCARHHELHHCGAREFYKEFLAANYPKEFEFMNAVKTKPLKLCNEDIDLLTTLCRKNSLADITVFHKERIWI